MAAREESARETVDFEKRWGKLTECFLNFGTDPLENINLLTALCGNILGGTCALYNRLCDGKLVSWAQWQTPEDYNPTDDPEGHICYDVITGGSDEIYLVRNLLTSPYAASDPNVRKYNLQTYIGTVARLGSHCVGSLCVLFQSDYIPGKADNDLLKIIGRAIGIEEKRLQEMCDLSLSHQRLLKVLDSIEAIIFVADLKTRGILFMNQHSRKIFGNGLGKKCREVFQKDQTGSFNFCLDPGQKVNEESAAREIRNDRNGRWYKALQRRIEWIDGRSVGLQIAIDITERKQAEMALKERTDKFMLIADTLPGFIAYVNASALRYEFVNSAFEKSFGIPREKIIGSHIREIIGEKNYQFARKYINKVLSGKSASYENTFDIDTGTR